MIRLVIASVMFLASVPLASAMFVQAKSEPALKSIAGQVPEMARAPETKRDLVITAETEIKVDGRVCGLDQVPADAQVILVEVGPDRSEIRRIHFQTRK
jgi:hypothetical protein